MTNDPSSGLPPTPPPVNPYAPPKAGIAFGDTAAPDDAEAIRREFLNHEASIRSVGTLYMVGAVFCGLATLAMLLMLVVTPLAGGVDGLGIGLLLGMVALYALLTWLYYFMGKGLRAVSPKVRLVATIVTALGLLGFPIGTLISAFILYLLHSAKGKRVMTEEYQAVIAATPHIKYKTPLWMWILLGLLVLGILAIVAAGLVGALSA